MQRLSTTDVRAVLRFVGDAYSVAPPGDLRLHTIDRLRSLVPADMTAWVETRTGRPEVEVIASPRDPLPDGPRRFARVRDKHPILAHFERSRRGGAVKLSDFLSRAQYHRRPIYQEFFRPAGVEHQISIALPSAGPRLVRITLNRGRGDFSERDRLVLNLVRPHVAQVHQSVEAIGCIGEDSCDLEQAAEAVDVGLVALGKTGGVAHATPRAREQLDTYFGAHLEPPQRLPGVVAEWLATHRRPRLRGGVPLPRKPLFVEREGSRLEIRSVRSADRHLLVLRERTTRIAPRPLESLGLTRRQAEVLAWLARGKANIEIASILGISPNTVARHLETIFERLGVKSRTAAAAAAFTHMALA
jgi:DNA-binding CsgD family transcriptional regulator